MIPLTPEYYSDVQDWAKTTTGQVPVGFMQGIDAMQKGVWSDNYDWIRRDLTNTLGEQREQASQIGETLPNEVLVQNWLHLKNGNDSFANDARTNLDNYANLVNNINQKHGTNFQSAEQLFQTRAEQAQKEGNQSAEIASRASSTSRFVGGLIGGAESFGYHMYADPTDPVGALALIAPASPEGFAGNLLVRLGKLAATQAGLSALLTYSSESSDFMRDMYKAQGMNDDQIDAKIWNDTKGSAETGAALGPLGYYFFKGTGKGLGLTVKGISNVTDRLFGKDLPAKLQMAEELNKLDLGPRANADVANAFDAAHVEATSPLHPTPENLRTHAQILDEKTRSIMNGEDQLSTTSSPTLTRVVPDSIRPETGDIANARMQTTIYKQIANNLRDQTSQLERQAVESDMRLQQLNSELKILTPATKTKSPSIDAMMNAGLDNFSADQIRQIDARLAQPAPVISNAERETLLAHRAELIPETMRSDIQKRVKVVKQTIDSEKQAGKFLRDSVTANYEQIGRHERLASEAQTRANKIDVVPKTPNDAPPIRANMTPAEVQYRLHDASTIPEVDEIRINEARTVLQQRDLGGMSKIMQELDAQTSEIKKFVNCIGANNG